MRLWKLQATATMETMVQKEKFHTCDAFLSFLFGWPWLCLFFCVVWELYDYYSCSFWWNLRGRKGPLYIPNTYQGTLLPWLVLCKAREPLFQYILRWYCAKITCLGDSSRIGNTPQHCGLDNETWQSTGRRVMFITSTVLKIIHAKVWLWLSCFFFFFLSLIVDIWRFW